MEITSDVILRGADWNEAISNLSSIFQSKTNYSVYILSAAIGIMYDKQLSSAIEANEENKFVPRTVLLSESESLDFLFQTAILTTINENISEEERLELAFGEKKTDFGKMAFLTRFANFGVTKLIEKISQDPIETMENLKNFLASTMEGTNFDIDPISDDELIVDDINFD